jgi:hypothetical protein
MQDNAELVNIYIDTEKAVFTYTAVRLAVLLRLIFCVPKPQVKNKP